MLNAIALWWKRWIKSRSQLFELESSGADQVERMAKDLSMSPSELRRLVIRGSDEADLLHRRLAILHLDVDALARSEPLLFRDLQKLCALCESRGRCVRDLAREANREPTDVESRDWRDYCPNTATLNMLSAVQSCSNVQK